jgi:sodium-dependent dicarboxylate transporter 2/3/5
MIKAGWVLNLIGIILLVIFMFTVFMWVLGFSVEMPEWAYQPVISGG